MNQPVDLVDHSGNFVWFIPGVVGAVVNAGFYTWETLTHKPQQFSFSTFAGRAVGGFVAPYAFAGCAIAGGLGSAFAGGCASAAGSAADRVVQNFESGVNKVITGRDDPRYAAEDISWNNLEAHTTIGVITGPVSKVLSGVLGPNVGRNATTVSALLFGRETQNVVVREVLDHLLERFFNSFINTASAAGKRDFN